MRLYSLRYALAVLFIMTVLVSLQAFNVSAFEALGVVVRVIDGDTIDVDIIEVYKERFSELKNKRERIRLADINAPELGTAEGEASKLFLARLIQGALVYIDVDDIYVHDRYGRIIAVIYKPVNSTHAVNVNMLLVVENMADIVDYRNEFDPRKWQLYVEIPEYVKGVTAEPGAVPGIWRAAIIVLVVFVAFIAAIIVIRKIRR